MAAAETLVRELFEHAGIKIGGSGPGDITVHDPRFYGRVVREASIGFGESYMDGWWDTDALDMLLEKIMRGGLREKVTGSARMKLLTAKALLMNLQSKERSGKSVEAHYDIGNDLYTKMLDPRMVYTCAYWKGATTLAEAQENKLDLICRKLGLQKGMRVLDLGCGWGGFAGFAAERYGCSVVGVTLSKDQHALGRELWKHLDVDLRLCDYRDVTGTFDRVSSIGMMEHVGPKNHRHVMEVVHRSLVADGVAVIHTIANNRSRQPRHRLHREVHLPQRRGAVDRPARARHRGAVRAGRSPEHRPRLRPHAHGVVGQLRPRLPRAEGQVRPALLPDVEVLPAARPPARRARATASSITWC